jgi:hypothetical protein
MIMVILWWLALIPLWQLLDPYGAGPGPCTTPAWNGRSCVATAIPSG